MTQKNDKISSIKQRILQYIDYKGITKQDFCEITGISYSNLRSKSLESEFGGVQITQILSLYDEISSDWLILGKGNMLRSHCDEQSESPDTTEKIELLNARIRDKESLIESLNDSMKSKDKTIYLLEEKVEFLEAKVAHYESANGVAAAS